MVNNFIFGGFPYGVDLDDLITEALQVHARIGSYSHLGTSTATRDKRLSEIINRSILQFMRAVPGTGLTVSDNLITVADQVNYDIPERLQGLAINRMVWNNTGTDPINDDRELKYITQAQFQNMPRFIQSHTITKDFPDYWTMFNFTQTRTTLTGTVEILTTAPTALVGTDTVFTEEVEAGDELMIYGQTVTVASVNSDVSITLDDDWASVNVTGELCYLLDSIRIANINLYPVPAMDGNVINISYQQMPALLTGTQVTDRVTTPIMITEIPTEFQNVLAMNLAINILTTDEMQARKSWLINQYGEALDAVQKTMAAPEAADNGTAQYPGELGNLLETDSIFAGMAGTFYR